MSSKFISKDQVFQMNEKHGWFQFGDAQSDVSNAFANEAIERYERIRNAALEFLTALEKFAEYEKAMDNGDDISGMLLYAEFSDMAHAAIAKATGEA